MMVFWGLRIKNEGMEHTIREAASFQRNDN